MKDLPFPIEGVVALGAELEWGGGTIVPVESNIDWDAMRACNRAAIALRIAPLAPSRTVADVSVAAVVAEAQHLIGQARSHRVAITELQLDFDCPVRQLNAYAGFAAKIRSAVRPVSLVVTTLPAWLDSPPFRKLVDNCDGFVLQVHSIPLHDCKEHWQLFDRSLARKWIERAATYHKNFAVALPTYRCLAAYAPDGRLLGVAMDSVQNIWPPDTRFYEIAADPDELADAVAQWNAERPTNFAEVIWYRLPVPSDLRNWRTATFAAVVKGRRPERRLEVVRHGSNPVDVAIRNAGEADEHVSGEVLVRGGAPGNDVDALAGWHVERRASDTAFVVDNGPGLQLRPGETRSIGWVRAARPNNLKFQITRAGL